MAPVARQVLEATAAAAAAGSIRAGPAAAACSPTVETGVRRRSERVPLAERRWSSVRREAVAKTLTSAAATAASEAEEARAARRRARRHARGGAAQRGSAAVGRRSRRRWRRRLIRRPPRSHQHQRGTSGANTGDGQVTITYANPTAITRRLSEGGQDGEGGAFSSAGVRAPRPSCSASTSTAREGTPGSGSPTR